jgi:Polyketide cyclase / dehydrase and lipid transport
VGINPRGVKIFTSAMASSCLPNNRGGLQYPPVLGEPPRAKLRCTGPKGPVPRGPPALPVGDRGGHRRQGEKVKDMTALTYRTETAIRRSPEDVFKFCNDLRSELEWNPKAKYVEKLTDGPVGVGTRYRARWSNSGPTAVEVVAFDRPRSWETIATARGMGIRFRGTVTDTAPGARYTASLELQPKRLARLIAPLALLVMRRQDQQHMHRIREALESSTVMSN